MLSSEALKLDVHDSTLVNLLESLIKRNHLINFWNVFLLYWQDVKEWILLFSIPVSHCIANVVIAHSAT
jgi:hypothetical protein